MRIALVVPTRTDPAHRRAAEELAAAYRALGHACRIHPERGRFGAACAAALRRDLDGGRIDAVHVHFFSRGFSALRKFRWPEGVKLLLTHQGAGTGLLEEKSLFRKMAARAHAVTAVSRAGARELAGLTRGRGPAPQAVGNGAAAPAPASRHRRRRPAPYMLTVGRVAAYKGLDVLALAFARLSAEGSALKWLAVGPDQTGGAFARFIAKLGLEGRMRLCGPLSARAVGKLMSDCLFFCQPSRRENHPMALLEALAAGKPVVVTRVDGSAEIVRGGIDGLSVPAGNAGALYRALKRLDGDAGLRRRLGRAAKLRARRFTWKAAARSYLTLLSRAS